MVNIVETYSVVEDPSEHVWVMPEEWPKEKFDTKVADLIWEITGLEEEIETLTKERNEFEIVAMTKAAELEEARRELDELRTLVGSR